MEGREGVRPGRNRQRSSARRHFGEGQGLEAAITRVNSLADDAPRDEVDAAWREAAAAHEAAFASLEVAARAADVRGALESTNVAAVADPGSTSVP